MAKKKKKVVKKKTAVSKKKSPVKKNLKKKITKTKSKKNPKSKIVKKTKKTVAKKVSKKSGSNTLKENKPQKIPKAISGFEDKIKDVFPHAEIVQEESTFSLKNKNLNLENASKVLQIIQKVAGDLAGGSTNIEIISTQKNFIFFKKYFYKVDLDLNAVQTVDDLDLVFKIINPIVTPCIIAPYFF